MRHDEPIRIELTSIFVRGLSDERNEEEFFNSFFFISDLFGGIWSEVLQFLYRKQFGNIDFRLADFNDQSDSR